jgi:hypothetical protein
MTLGASRTAVGLLRWRCSDTETAQDSQVVGGYRGMKLSCSCGAHPAGITGVRSAVFNADREPRRAGTTGLLGDLPLVVSGIRHVGKEGNELAATPGGIADRSRAAA